MSNILKVAIPATQSFFYDSKTKPQIKAAMDRIYAQYKDAIDKSSALTKVPKEIITSFIFIESDGKPDAVSSAGAIGVMQLKPEGASDILVIENTKKRLSPEESQILSKNIGKRFTDGILKMKFLGDKKTVDGVTSAVWITKTDLLKPSLNILIGSIYIGILIDESSQNGKVDLHKVVIRYNKGYFADGKGKDIPDTVDQALVNTNTESKNYILKFLGKNGTLDTMQLA